MIEHCISAFMQKKEEFAYRLYVTDCVKEINHILAENFGGSYKTERYADILKPKKKDTRSGDEIAADIVQRAGLRIEDVC